MKSSPEVHIGRQDEDWLRKNGNVKDYIKEKGKEIMLQKEGLGHREGTKTLKNLHRPITVAGN